MNQQTLLLLTHVAVGYIYSVVFGGLLTYCFAYYLGKAIKEFPEDKEYYRWTAALVGITERILYTSAVIFNRLEFIAVWLAIKTASQWRRWGEKEESKQNGTNPYQERANFNSYLINTGLSIAYGALGGQFVIWLSDNDGIYIAVASGIGLVLLNIVFIGFAYYKYKQTNRDNEKMKKGKKEK